MGKRVVGVIYLNPAANSLKGWPDFWGVYRQPGNGIVRGMVEGRLWAGDNGTFSGKFDEKRFWQWLQRMQPYKSTCLFIVVPDAPYDPQNTMRLWGEYAVPIRQLGFPVAFAAQDGQETLPFPPDYDVLFIGGSTDWKLGAGADECIRRAQADGKWVHVGRVNSARRIRHFQLVGVDSIDGTCLCYGPRKNRPNLERAMSVKPLFRLCGGELCM